MPASSPTSPNLLILVDDRERPSGVPFLLARRPGVRLEFRRLALGDYVVDGRVTVERKTTLDFATSLIDGRLFSQVARLKRDAGRPVMIVEGGSLNDTGRDVAPEAIRGALVALAVMWYLPVLRSRDPDGTADLLCVIARQAARDARGLWPRPGPKPKLPDRRKLFVLQGLPGVGPALARRLLERFGSIESAMCADAASLQDVRGIGRAKTRAIRAIVE